MTTLFWSLHELASYSGQPGTSIQLGSGAVVVSVVSGVVGVSLLVVVVVSGVVDAVVVVVVSGAVDAVVVVVVSSGVVVSGPGRVVVDSFSGSTGSSEGSKIAQGTITAIATTRPTIP